MQCTSIYTPAEEHVALVPAMWWKTAKPGPHQPYQHSALSLAFWWGLQLFSNCLCIEEHSSKGALSAFETRDQIEIHSAIQGMESLCNGSPEINGTTYGVIHHYPLWVTATVNKLWKLYSSYSCPWWFVIFQNFLNKNKWNEVGESGTLISVSTDCTFVPSVWAIGTLHKYLPMPVGSYAKL